MGLIFFVKCFPAQKIKKFLKISIIIGVLHYFFFTHAQQLQQIFELTKLLAIMMMTYGPLAIFCDL